MGGEVDRVNATVDALFRYRDRTRHMYDNVMRLDANAVAREEGLE